MEILEILTWSTGGRWAADVYVPYKNIDDGQSWKRSPKENEVHGAKSRILGVVKAGKGVGGDRAKESLREG